MSYQAMARRYRPQKFADVAAQSHITETLRRAVDTGRTAPAYLFAGPRGSGKTTVARVLAKAVNCSKARQGEPCAECDSCRNIADGRSLDVLEIDGASNNSVDDVRELRENVRYAASEPGKRKVYIIDEVHMLSAGAFNALLKTLEEPPGHVLFVFATTEPRKVPQTVLSRCQRFDFRRLLTEEILERLQVICKREKVDLSPAALFMIAKRADGSLRDGLSLLDQVLSSTSGRIDEEKVAAVLGLVREEVYFELTEAILGRDPRRALELLHTALREGADPSSFALGLVEHLRNLLLLAVDAGLRRAVQLGDAHLERAMALAGRFRSEDLLYLLNRAAAIYEETRLLGTPAVVLEAAMVEFAHFESRVVLSEVLERLGGLSGAPPGGAPAGGGQEQESRPATRSPARSKSGTRRASALEDDASPSAALAGGAAAASAGDPGGESGPEPGVRGSAPAGTRSSTPAASQTENLGPAATRTFPVPSTADHSPPTHRLVTELFAAPGSAAGGSATAGRSGAGPIAAGGPYTPPRAPASAGVVAPTAPMAELDLDALRTRWGDFTQLVRGSKAVLAQCLSEGVPVRLQGSVLELEFGEGASFHVHLLREAATRAELEEQVFAYFGRHLQLRALERGAVAPAAARLTDADVAASRRAAIEDVVQGTPNLQEILEVFDGEILDDREV